MLLAFTVALVIAGIALLVTGLVQSDSSYIYVSMACAVVAFILLIIFTRLSKRQAEYGGVGGPEQGDASTSGPSLEKSGADPATTVPAATASARPEDGAPATAGADPSTGDGYPALSTRPVDATTTTPAAPKAPVVPTGFGSGAAAAGAGTAAADESVDDDDDWADDGGFDDEPEDSTDVVPAVPGVATASGTGAPPATRPADAAPRSGGTATPADAATPGDTEDWEEDDWADEGEFVFPIEDYDDLRVSEILPILGELEGDELIDVRDRERAGKARGTILRRIETLLAEAQGTAAAPTAAAAPAVTEATAPAPARSSRSRAAAEPIPGYDTMRVAEILPRLNTLDADGLATVERAERAGANRTTVLNRIARLRDAAPAAPAPAAPAPAAPPAKKATKTAPKKTPAKKAPAPTSVVPDPAAAPPAPATKKAPAAKAAGKAGGTKAMAKKAPATKSAAKAPAKKAPATKRAASARKAAAETGKATIRKGSAKKAPAKKVAPPVTDAPPVADPAAPTPEPPTTAAPPVSAPIPSAPASPTPPPPAPAPEPTEDGEGGPGPFTRPN